MDDYICYVDGLMLGVGCVGDIVKLEEFFDNGKYGRDGFAQMINGLIYHVIALEEFVWY